MRVLVVLLVVCLHCTPAFAQYYLDTPKGYKLTPVTSGGLLAGAELRKTAADCTGITLDGLFAVQPGMSRFFELDRGRNYDKPDVHEYQLTRSGAKPPASAAAGRPVYIAFGTKSSSGYNDYVVASLSNEGGTVKQISSFTLGAEFCGGIYALDLTGEGGIDLAVPYATGAGGGGGIEVRSIQPNGRITWFGNDELDSTLFSQSGYINLVDFDSDGDWEIETSAPVLCSACGYQWNDLYTFDKDSGNWETGESQFPAFYKPQQDFYRQLNAAVTKMVGQPQAYAYSGKEIEAKYAVQIGGHWYSLDPFMSNGGSGKPDRAWVSTLASLVDSWH
jgi:hypothetical protein